MVGLLYTRLCRSICLASAGGAEDAKSALQTGLVEVVTSESESGDSGMALVFAKILALGVRWLPENECLGLVPGMGLECPL